MPRFIPNIAVTIFPTPFPSPTLPLLPLPPTHTPIHHIRTPRKRLLNWRPRPTRNIQLRKPRPNPKNIHPRRIKHLLARRDRNRQICILGQPCDEEHEAPRLDLHFCKVCGPGGDVGVPGHGLLVRF